MRDNKLSEVAEVILPVFSDKNLIDVNFPIHAGDISFLLGKLDCQALHLALSNLLWKNCGFGAFRTRKN